MAVVLNNDWDQLLQEEFEKEYYQKLRLFLIQEYRSCTVYPDMYEIFTALKLTSYSDTKAVIIGQDPYHGPNQAHGLAFSVKPGVAIPPSLLNIFKELQSDLGCTIPDNGYLVPWAKQGVLLLNAILTVRANQPKSHRNRGWEQFTSRVIEILNEKNTPIVFLLWGNDAKQKAQMITNPRHLILTAPTQALFPPVTAFSGAGIFPKPTAFSMKTALSPSTGRFPTFTDSLLKLKAESGGLPGMVYTKHAPYFRGDLLADRQPPVRPLRLENIISAIPRWAAAFDFQDRLAFIEIPTQPNTAVLQIPHSLESLFNQIRHQPGNQTPSGAIFRRCCFLFDRKQDPIFQGFLPFMAEDGLPRIVKPGFFVVIDFVYLLSCDELEVFLGLFIFAKLQIDCDNRNGIEDIVPFLFHNRQQFLHLFKLGFLQFLFQPLLALNSVEVRQDTGKKSQQTDT